MKPTPSHRPTAATGGARRTPAGFWFSGRSFGYFWDFAHPESGMAHDRGRSDGTVENDLLAVGGTGFGIMAMIVAVERGWIARDDAVARLLKMLDYLGKADSYQRRVSALSRRRDGQGNALMGR